MRLDKLTIGSAKDSPTHHFKNLKNVTIDFDQNQWVTVVMGRNGTGKSNVLEALAIIFRDLITYKSTSQEKRRDIPRFAFKLAYRMGAGKSLQHIHIEADPDRENDPLTIHVATDSQARGEGLVIAEGEEPVSAFRGKAIKFATFLNSDAQYLPRYVFSYYSGESTRMHEIFRPYLESYDNKLRNGEDPGLKRLFYALPVHSQFVLLAFLIQPSEVVRAFLDDHLGLDPEEGLESVLFVLKEPGWSKKRGNKNIPGNGDDRFWGAKGVVQKFLDRLQNIALAPISISRDKQLTLWNKKTTEFQYLFVKDIDALRRLVGEQKPAHFFRDLESTYVSELIEEVRIRVRLKKNNGSVTFRELSEGEQQLLTVLGLLCFTAEDESLFLLDEPDTHLNPQWVVDYISYLKQFIASGSKQEETSHVLLTTHNPLAIAELSREQIQILARQGDINSTTVTTPTFNPRGMGFAGILTSDLFQLSSSLDRVTYNALETEAILAHKSSLSDEEQFRLAEAQEVLKKAEFRHSFMDPLMEEYSRARSELIGVESACSDGLSEYPGSPLRRKIARKILLKTLGISADMKKTGDE